MFTKLLNILIFDVSSKHYSHNIFNLLFSQGRSKFSVFRSAFLFYFIGFRLNQQVTGKTVQALLA